MRLLLGKYHASLTIESREGRNCLHYAAMHCHLQPLLLLLEHGAVVKYLLPSLLPVGLLVSADADCVMQSAPCNQIHRRPATPIPSLPTVQTTTPAASSSSTSASPASASPALSPSTTATSSPKEKDSPREGVMHLAGKVGSFRKSAWAVGMSLISSATHATAKVSAHLFFYHFDWWCD